MFSKIPHPRKSESCDYNSKLTGRTNRDVECLKTKSVRPGSNVIRIRGKEIPRIPYLRHTNLRHLFGKKGFLDSSQKEKEEFLIFFIIPTGHNTEEEPILRVTPYNVIQINVISQNVSRQNVTCQNVNLQNVNRQNVKHQNVIRYLFSYLITRERGASITFCRLTF